MLPVRPPRRYAAPPTPALAGRLPLTLAVLLATPVATVAVVVVARRRRTLPAHRVREGP